MLQFVKWWPGHSSIKRYLSNNNKTDEGFSTKEHLVAENSGLRKSIVEYFGEGS